MGMHYGESHFDDKNVHTSIYYSAMKYMLWPTYVIIHVMLYLRFLNCSLVLDAFIFHNIFMDFYNINNTHLKLFPILKFKNATIKFLCISLK